MHPPTLQSNLRIIRSLAALAALVWSGAGWAQAVVTPTPAATPPKGVSFAPEEDPNAQGLSRAERIRRQEAYIRKKLAAQREGQAADNKKALEDLANQDKPKGPERPNAPPPADPAANPTMPPTNPELPLAKTGEQSPTQWAYKMSADSRNVLEEDPWGFRKIAFYLNPASVVATQGETFTTTCKLLNMDRAAPDRIEIVLRYPVNYLEPVSVHQDGIIARLAEEPQWGVDADLGELRYTARLAQPLDGIDNSIIEIQWKALKPGEDISLELKEGGRFSRALKGEHQLTENEFGEGGVLAGTSIRILEPKREVPTGGRVVVDAALEGFAPALAPLGSLDDRPPVLWLDYDRRGNYAPGQWVVMDVVLDNPHSIPFDDLQFTLKYDPASVEIADTDERNWIRTGINILDGPFREHWKWDRLGEDRVDTKEGLIIYRMGRSDFRRQPSGVVARIFARIRRPVSEPLVDWVVNDGRGDRRPGTGVWLMGENLIERHARRTAPPEMILIGARVGGGPPEKADPAIYRERKK